MKHDIYFFDEDHKYVVDGEEVPSVTTLLNYLSDIEYGKITPSVLEQAAKRGKLVHEYTELIDFDVPPDEVEYEVKEYLKAYTTFLRDYNPEWVYIETPVYSEQFRYAGTVDRFGKIDGKYCVLDIKTTSSPTKLQKFIVSSQTIAYRQAITETFGAFGVIDRYALYLGSDGEYNLVNLREYDKKYDYNPWEMFNECLKLYSKVQGLKNLKPHKGGE